MYLASRGYWGGNPESILKAPAELVISAYEFAVQWDKEKLDIANYALDSVSRILSGVVGRLRA